MLLYIATVRIYRCALRALSRQLFAIFVHRFFRVSRYAYISFRRTLALGKFVVRICSICRVCRCDRQVLSNSVLIVSLRSYTCGRHYASAHSGHVLAACSPL